MEREPKHETTTPSFVLLLESKCTDIALDEYDWIAVGIRNGPCDTNLSTFFPNFFSLQVFVVHCFVLLLIELGLSLR